jgi:hypothetical protein
MAVGGGMRMVWMGELWYTSCSWNGLKNGGECCGTQITHMVQVSQAIAQAYLSVVYDVIIA